jgi:hypothetical protein
VTLLLLSLVVAVYGRTLSYPLVFDDVYWFSPRNIRVLGDMGFESRFLSKKAVYFLFQLTDGHVAYLRMVVILLHVAVAVALFWFSRKLIEAVTAGPGPSGSRTPLAAAIAALAFAIHPVQAYTVAYPGELEIVLATGFSLLCLICWLEGLHRRRWWWLIASAGCYGAALLSKANLIMVPALVVAVTWLIEQPTWNLARQLAIPLALLAAIALGTVYMIAHSPPEIAATGYGQTRLALNALAGTEARHGYLLSATSEMGFFFRYLIIWLFPNPQWMSIDIQLPLARGFAVWPDVACVIAFALWPMAALALVSRRGWLGLCGFGLLWPWVLYLTEFATTRVNDAFVLYRSYPWIIGICLAASVGLTRLGRRIVFPLCALVAGTLCILGISRLGSFATAYDVWDDAIRKNRPDEAVSPAAYRAYINRGSALLALHRADEALSDFAVALRLNPRSAEAHFDLAAAQYQRRDYSAALEETNLGLAEGKTLHPSILARAYANRAAILLDMARLQDGLADLEHAVELDPSEITLQHSLNLLRAQLRSGRPSDTRAP